MRCHRSLQIFYLPLFFILCTFLLLAGCDETPPLTYAYLIQSPTELQQAFARCQRDASTSDDCQLVYAALNDFAALLNEQQQDPEKFGQKLIASEVACTESEDSSDKACEDVKIRLAVIGMNSPE